MEKIVNKYMDDETTRIFCFFLRNKFDPESRICKGCARFQMCERDAKKMIAILKYIPWLESAYEREMKKYTKECPVCG